MTILSHLLQAYIRLNAVPSIKVLFVILVLVTGGTLTGCGGAVKSASTASGFRPADAETRRAVEENDKALAEMKALIAEVEAANVLQRQADGTISLNGILTRSTTLSPAARQFAEESLRHVNEGVKAGTLVVHDDLTIKETFVTRANEQGLRWVSWWGIKGALNNTNSQRLASVLSYGGSVAGAGLGVLAGGPYGAVLGAALGGFPGFVVSWYAAPGTGIFIYYRWSGGRIFLESQPR